VLQCALEFAQHGPVSGEPSSDARSADSSMLAADNAATPLGLHFTPTAAGIMDVDMESPHSLNRYPRTLNSRDCGMQSNPLIQMSSLPSARARRQ